MQHTLFFILAVLPLSLGLVHKHSEVVPRGWTAANESVTATGINVTFTIALARQNIDQLESKLLEVSTPGSPSYGKHWDSDDIDAFFAPSSDAVSSVVDWLTSQGISSYQVGGAFVDFLADLSTANALLNASYNYYTNGWLTEVRTPSYSIPSSLGQHVALVDPGTYLASAKQIRRATPPRRATIKGKQDTPVRTSVDAACETSITPSCLKRMYNVGSYAPTANSTSRIGFGSFLNQSVLFDDLFQFEDHFNIPRQNISVELIADATHNQNASTAQYHEASLDVQVMVGIAHPLPVTQFVTGGAPPFIINLNHPTAERNFNEPYVPYYRKLLSKPNKDLPQVISHSYGEQEDSVPYEYARLTCELMGLMGLRGTTILQASGDTGVGSTCLAPDFETVEFIPNFPATCPWSTAVGGTMGVSPESAWEASSGGFSRYFPRPPYQDAAINKYMADHVRPETREYYAPYTNWDGRAYPDVAAHSRNPVFEVVYGGKLSAGGGTSASAPVWAGIVGLLNDARLLAGKPVLGWLNPLIYGLGRKALVDIDRGYSIGCNGRNPQTNMRLPEGAGIVPGARWNATEGWDPVTGFGTPDFEKLKDLVLAL